MKTKIINLFSGPGAGKSTTAAGLFYLMKRYGMSVELTTEYAKDAVWEERHNIFPDQAYIFAKQHRKISRLVGKVEYVISDSPLLISAVYIPKDYPESFLTFVEEMFDKYNNINFFIERHKKYVNVGRNQNEKQARVIDKKLKDYLSKFNFPLEVIKGDGDAARAICDKIIMMKT